MRHVTRLLGVVLVGLGILFSAAFYDRYWRWRDCFNELGRCFDPVSQDVYLEQSGLVWGGLAALFLGIGIVLILRPTRRARTRIY
ncbi:MAG: hypothetical protein ABI457_06210 [Hyphomicrobium sp.]